MKALNKRGVFISLNSSFHVLVQHFSLYSNILSLQVYSLGVYIRRGKVHPPCFVASQGSQRSCLEVCSSA